MIGKDGFTYYTCTGECGETKMAALFLPSEIASGSLICRACLGEVTVRFKRPRNPKTATRHAYQRVLAKRTASR